MFIDTHAHINNSIYSNISQVVDDFKAQKVLKVINCSENILTCKNILKLSKDYPGILYPAVGIHPLNVDESINQELENLGDILRNNRVIAIGEIGLDYYYSKENKNEQIKAFEAQLDFASRYNLPVIIHSREATQDTIDILKKYNLKGVIHCFSGSLEVAKQYIKMGYMLGIGGVITFKNSNLKDVIANVSLENIILETDSPFLTPEPYRKFQNEPKYIPVIAKFIANLKNITLDDVMDITTRNAHMVFDFSSFK